MDIKSGFRISIILRVIGVFFFATAPYISYADLLPFVQPEKDEKTGSISGVIEPPDSNAVVIARRRGSNHGGAVQISLKDGSYRISRLIGGTYDLMVLCQETDYYSIVGQEVDSSFLGKEPNSLTATDANELRLLLDRLSEVYSKAYTKKNLAGIVSSPLFSQNYVDYEEKVDYPAIFPKIEKWFNRPDRNILRVTQKRKIWLVGGNRQKAYIICNLVEEIAMTMTRKGVEYFRIDSYVWDELIYFVKENNAWKVLSKRPINDRILVYTNAPTNIYSGYLKYVVGGPLVGIEVIPATDNSGNNYVLPPILDKDKSREYPYKFEITPDPRKMKKKK